MNHDYDIDWLTEHRPEPSPPSPGSTDLARASLLAHGTRERRRRRASVAIGALSAVAVAGAAVAIGAGAGHPASGRALTAIAIAPPPPTTTTTAPRVAPSTPLVRLASYVRLLPPKPQAGDATLVVRNTVIDGVHETDGAVDGGYDLYTDSGQYYYAPDSLAELQQAVDAREVVIDSGNEAQALNTIAAAANGTPAQAREAALSTFPHGLDPMPTPAEVRASDRKLERMTKRPVPYVAPTRAGYIRSQDSDLWIAATEALAVGAGRSDVRAGAMKALSTITGVTQTLSEVGGVRALKVDFPDDGQPEIIWLNARTGVPIQEQDGGSSATAFEVERVTAANLPTQISPSARLR
jgi:hypothetical protein